MTREADNSMAGSDFDWMVSNHGVWGWKAPVKESVSGVSLLQLSPFSLPSFPFSPETPDTQANGWLDSSVALHWIKGNGDYRQFVANRVSKIQQHSFIQWRYVLSDQNPADLGSRGGRVDKSAKLWWEGPAWLAEPKSWPPDIVTVATSETQAEAKVVREALFVTKTEDDVLNETLEKHGYWKAIRIVAWIARFLSNCKAKSTKKSGPLTTEETETETQVERWIYRVQSRFAATDKYQKDGPRLKLQKNKQGLFECRGRIQGDYPIYLPDDDLFNKKLVTSANENTLHGGVSLTMA